MKTKGLLFTGIAALVMFLSLHQAKGQQWANNGNNIYNTNTGYVGIGTSIPSYLLHVAKNMVEPAISVQNLGGSGGATYSMIDNASGANWKFKATSTGGFKVRDQAHSLDVFQIEPNSTANALYIASGGHIGINTNDPVGLLEVTSDDNHYSRICNSSWVANHFYHRSDATQGDGQCTVLAFFDRDAENPGTSYHYGNTNSSIFGYTYHGDSYTFGIHGLTWFSSGRCGGILGANYAGDTWGSLGYQSSGLVSYGGYFTSSTTGSGKSGNLLSTIGIGAYGDLIGADIHGKVYGSYIEGENYALYTNGDVYKNRLDIHLQQNQEGANTPLYTSVSSDVTIMTAGTATLSNGKANVVFEKAFTECVSAKEPVVVTVTPVGSPNGVYLSQVNREGFQVVELNDGKSSVTVNYIAVGKRAGYEKPQLAREVVDAGYTGKLARGLHNDNDIKTDGDGLYYENGNLMVGVHPSTQPGPDKDAEQSAEMPLDGGYSGLPEK